MPDITITVSSAGMTRLETAYGVTGNDLKEAIKAVVKVDVVRKEGRAVVETAIGNLTDFTW